MGMILSIFDLDSELLSGLIAVILQFAAIVIPNLIRMSDVCKTSIFNKDSFSLSFFNSL
jgi:hypothetical protein